MTQPEKAPEPAVVEPKRTKMELEAEIARTRDEVRQTLDELSGRLNPQIRAHEAVEEARLAASDVVTLVKGGGLPENDTRRERNVRLVVGVTVLAAAVVTTIVVKAVRSHREG